MAQLFAQAFARARDLYGDVPEAVIAAGAWIAETGPRDGERFARVAGSGLFEDGQLELAPGGLKNHGALVVEPQAVLDRWLGGCAHLVAEVGRIEHGAGGWVVYDRAGVAVLQADLVVLAAGAACQRLAPGLELGVVRGQVSVAPVWTPAPEPAIGAGYVIPTRRGLLFGATHDRDQADTAVRAEDHARNLALLATVRPDLAAALREVALEGRAGLRAACTDFLPLAGAVEGEAPGLFVLAGLGSRGFCAAPLLAEHVAALALGAPSPLPSPLAGIVNPARFARRRARRGG